MLEFLNVVKVYRGGVRGVDGVTMRLGPGLVGLLGPNGAGKSSLMRIGATVTRPTSGQVLFDGTDAVARPDVLRRNLGYLPQDFGVYPHLSAREFLSYLAAVKGLPARAARRRIGELLELLDLAGVGKRPLGKYSGGMLRRVGIAQALLADPRVLIVDEPTAGLDPEQRVLFRNLLADLAGDRVVLLSTHIVSDVESVASDIAIMAGGRLLLRGRPEDLLRQAEGRVWETTVCGRAGGRGQPGAAPPDVVLLDLFMPGLDGIAVLKALQADGLASGVLVLTSSQDDAHLVQAIRAGALSYLPKTADVDQVVASVRAAARARACCSLPLLRACSESGAAPRSRAGVASYRRCTSSTAAIAPDPGERAITQRSCRGLGKCCHAWHSRAAARPQPPSGLLLIDQADPFHSSARVRCLPAKVRQPTARQSRPAQDTA